MENSFEITLRELRRGDALADCSRELAGLVAAVKETGNAGELTLKLKIKPASKGDSLALVLQDQITTKLPKPDRPGSIFFANDQNRLQRNDPRQITMDLKTVEETEPSEIKQASNS